MDEYKTEKAVYTPNDFILWRTNGLLEITPKFQRRPVWRTPARSYFIDTLLRGMTVSPIYLRLAQNKTRTKTVREVVDGQQRMRSVLDFIAGEYRLSKTLKAEWKGKTFDQLADDQQLQIRSFSFSTEVFKGISDKQILEVFCRLNMNGVKLNEQELRNGRFFGLFKQACFGLALEYLEFWRKHRIFSEQQIARMLEAELTSELLIAGHVGMQDKKKSITDYYEKWDTVYPDEDRHKKRFEETMAVISDTFSEDGLAATEFRRPPLFYTLFCVVSHYMFGLPGIQRATPKKRFTADARDALKDAVSVLSEQIVNSKDPTIETPARFQSFVAAVARQTDNLNPRKIRFNALFGEAF
jgi:hypothetical protein